MQTKFEADGLTQDLQKLHDWLQHLNQPNIRLRDICYRGPHAVRKREKAIRLTEILTGHGWLIPNPTRRRDRKEWQIVRGRGVETVATMSVAHPAPLQGD
jgi:hypothetical protein